MRVAGSMPIAICPDNYREAGGAKRNNGSVFLLTRFYFRAFKSFIINRKIDATSFQGPVLTFFGFYPLKRELYKQSIPFSGAEFPSKYSPTRHPVSSSNDAR